MLGLTQPHVCLLSSSERIKVNSRNLTRKKTSVFKFHPQKYFIVLLSVVSIEFKTFTFF